MNVEQRMSHNQNFMDDSLTSPSCLRRVGRKWTKRAAGGLCISGAISAAGTVVGYLSENWYLFSMGLFYTVCSLPGAFCMLKNLPRNEFEQNVNNYSEANEMLKISIAQLNQEIKIQKKQIVELHTALEEAETLFQQSKKESSVKSKKLQDVIEELAIKNQKLSAIEVLHTKYQETAKKIEQSIATAIQLHSEIPDQIKKIEEARQTIEKQESKERQNKEKIVEIVIPSIELQSKLINLKTPIVELTTLIKENQLQQEIILNRIKEMHTSNKEFNQLLSEFDNTQTETETLNNHMQENAERFERILKEFKNNH